MRLSILLENVLPISVEADCDISRIVLDSRKVKKGDLFVAVKGAVLDGHHYIADAISNGAAAVLVDCDEANPKITFQQDRPLIPIRALKNQMGPLAARFYGYPAKKLHLIGVTGTNGKTSCTHFIAQALQRPCGVIGTLGSGLYGALHETGLTTPDAVTLQASLQQFVEQGAETVAMEVSSHSIDQGRVNGLTFETAIFTNLTQDHLDYHGSMAAYAAVKRRFLAESSIKRVIVNADDDYGRQWIAELAQQSSVLAYSTQGSALGASKVPLIYTENVQLSLQGIRADVFTPWGEGELVLPLIGRFNLSNVLAVLAALCCHGMSFSLVCERLAQLTPIPGRMQTLTGPGLPLVVVDYAHTPDALEKVLQALRSHCKGRLICVFGCGGDRDAGKRPRMGRIAERLADEVIVTNDNPRHERPEEIARQIREGFVYSGGVSVELNRSQAIEKSIQWATVDDCVLIAGKGAERYQQIGDEKIPFDDVAIVGQWLAEK